MPNRMIRDWTDSDRVNLLTAHAERFFTRLIMKADDFGCYYADTRLLKSNLFPLTEGMRDTDISRWMDECQKAGLIVVYEASAKRFIEIKDFRQRLRVKKRKFPPPPEMTDTRPTDDGHMTAACPPEVEEEVEVETEEEVEAYPPGNENGSVVMFDIEAYLLNNQKTFEECCMSAQKNADVGREVLKKYHLWLQENEKYPKSKLSLISGFKRWLLSEKNKNGINQQPAAGSNGKPGTSEARVNAARKW